MNDGARGNGAPDPTAVVVILNPAARDGAVLRRIEPLRAAFAAHGLEAALITSDSEDHAGELAAEFAAQGAPVVVALGGDGMARSVAAGLLGTRTALGIIAGGRGNDLIGKLGIPKGIEAAVSVIAEGRDRVIDVLDLDGKVSLGNVCLGLDSAVQRHANAAKCVKGRWVYLYGIVRAILPPECIDLELTVDGERTAFRGYTAGFANSGRYGGGLRLSPTAALDDGLIDIVLLKDVALPRLAAELVAFSSGKHDRHPHIHFGRAREVHISTPEGADPIEIVADGDAVARTPATLRVRPASLTVRVPRARRLSAPSPRG
ncbi:diacylglycerol/lipid kinase family protein [Brevibacterium renqingii]|uniref:diacylglycerol/lipid kinase family protein n=1 Tax=Brevibacterium renqingii TaxID=2776916 RepID=UPI001ADFB066|nr:diacylglycerol kinase family protein [Brevibacterium renqingii]